jgi:hypothetical protein
MKYITILTFFLFTYTLQAQAPIGFLLSVGGNYSTIGSDDLLVDPSAGYKFGLAFNFGYHESYSYQIEVFQNKSTFDLLAVDANLEPTGSAKFSRTTADLGFFFNYYVLLPDEDKFYFGPQAGINFSFGGGELQAEKNVAPGDQYYLPYQLNETALTSLPKFNYGAGLGLTGGYNDFRFDFRYTFGLNNILQDVQTNSRDENNNYTGPTLNGKVNTLSFTLSYRLNKLFGYE